VQLITEGKMSSAMLHAYCVHRTFNLVLAMPPSVAQGGKQSTSKTASNFWLLFERGWAVFLPSMRNHKRIAVPLNNGGRQQTLDHVYLFTIAKDGFEGVSDNFNAKYYKHSLSRSILIAWPNKYLTADPHKLFFIQETFAVITGQDSHLWGSLAIFD